MKIGNLEIRWVRQQRSVLPQKEPAIDRTGALAVPDTQPWWLAVHQIIDQAEAETIASSRQRNTDPNACMAAVNAGEGVDLVRRKLNDARELALTRQK